MQISPKDTLLNPFRKYVVFRGRSPRAEFWVFLLVSLMSFKLVDIGFYAFTHQNPNVWHDHEPRMWLISPDRVLDSATFNQDRHHWDKGLHHRDKRHDRKNWDNSSPKNPATTAANLDHSSCESLRGSIVTPPQHDIFCIESDDGRYRFAIMVNRIMAYWAASKAGLGLLLILPFIALVARRLHDCGRSGWWAMLLSFPATAFLLLLYIGFTRSKPE